MNGRTNNLLMLLATELSYDINSRPDWTHIGLHGIRRILGLGEEVL